MAVIPSTDVNLATEVRDVLSEAGGSVSNDLTSFFKSAAKINKWARYKPVNYTKSTPMTEAELKLANYGLSNYYIGRTTTAKTVMNEAIAGVDFYPYDPPTGGQSSPYRLTDFTNPDKTKGGYNTNAQAPYVVVSSDTLEPAQFPAYVPYYIYVNPQSELKISELVSFEDFVRDGKMGILWTSSKVSSYYLYYSSSIGELTDGINLDLEVDKEDTFHFLAVWFNFPVSEGNNDVTSMNDNFVPVPGSYQKVVVTQKEIWGVVSVNWTALNSLYYSGGEIQGFASSYPTFRLTYPNGSTPSCTYQLGVYVSVIADGGRYDGTYWYESEVLHHPAGSTTQTINFVDFPGSIALKDVIVGADETWEVENITIILDLRRIDGYGFLSLASHYEYNVSIQQ